MKQTHYPFPDRFVTREEAYELCAGRRSFDDISERFGIMPYQKFDGARTIKYSLYDIHEAIQKEKERQKHEIFSKASSPNQ